MKKKSSKYILNATKILAASAVLCSASLCATAPHALSTFSKANNNDLKDVKLRLNGELGDSAAYSLGGELGTRTQRIDAGMGYAFNDEDAVKLSVEYLSQNLKYTFSATTAESYKRHQAALGAAYQRKVDLGCVTHLDAALGWSSVASRNLDTAYKNGYINSRYLAGTEFYSASVGARGSLWETGAISVNAYLDHFKINRNHNSKRNITGVGVAFSLAQKINDSFSMDLKAQFRRAYNVYGVAINYLNLHRGVVLGAFLDRTQARYELPNTTTVGLQLTYSMDSAAAGSSSSSLSDWVSTPAFSQPEVLVAADDFEQLLEI